MYLKDLSTVAKNTRNLLGTVEPIDWDKDGKPIKYALYCEDGLDYIISNPKGLKKCKKLINRPVEIRGQVVRNNFGEYELKVEKIQRYKGGQVNKNYWLPDYSFHLNQSHFYKSAL